MTAPVRVSADLSDVRTGRLRDVDLARVPAALAALVRRELAVRRGEQRAVPAQRRAS